MNAKIKKMLPVGIVPGLHTEMGHHQTPGRGCNENRKLRLYRPGLYHAPAPRRVTVEEWEATNG